MLKAAVLLLLLLLLAKLGADWLRSRRSSRTVLDRFDFQGAKNREVLSR
jgi:hypothetical protein